MHFDARKIPNGSVIEGDLCIIGAGAAGISMAMDWNNTSKKVILLEGGGFEYETRIQDLYKGTTSGQKYYHLSATRMHCFGGTTQMWGGFCTPLDEIDFEKRDWVENSGWPFHRKELMPYYDKASEFVDIPSADFDVENWKKSKPEFKSLGFDKEVVRDKMWQFSPPTRFGTKYKDSIIHSPNIHLYTYANVTELVTNDAGDKIISAVAKNHEGVNHRIKASVFVLACGAIQNARLLLNSNKQFENGLGNQNDNVGRYFMEHLECRSAESWFNFEKSMEMYLYTWKKTKARAELSLSADTQRKYKILNGTSSFEPLIASKHSTKFTKKQSSDDPIENKNFELSLWERIQKKFYKTKDRLEKDSENAFELYIRMEQAPNPESRISLINESDALGMRKINLHWQLCSLAKKSILDHFVIVGREMGLSNTGRLKLHEYLRIEDSDTWPDYFTPGNHHMGTTRMSLDPKLGVVDENCKIHGIKNGFIASSSCFPTSGAANPTFTIIALSLRLSDHLRSRYLDAWS